MRLNAANLRTTLATIFGIDPQYVVPRQGNWFNPQAGEENPAKPLTWCAYKIEGERGITVAHYASDGVKNYSVVHKTAQLTLQFVGDQAEDLANSIAHWSHRQDVADGFSAYDAKVFADSGDVIVSDFDQQGVNTVYAYNVRVRIVWADEIDSGQTKPMPNIVFQPGPIAVQ